MIEIIGGLLFTAYIMQFYDSFSEALLNGMFMSVSATTNAGFDITGTSLMHYFNDYFVQIVDDDFNYSWVPSVFLFLIEVKSYFSKKVPHFRFSLFTKITTVTFGFLLVFGAVMIFILESYAFFQRNGMA